MHITVTEQAKKQIDDIKNERYLLLTYDTTDCGCGVNGVPTFRFTNRKEDAHTDVENGSFPTIIATQQMVFFADSMKLDFVNGMFRLSSSEGILNPFISVSSVKSN